MKPLIMSQICIVPHPNGRRLGLKLSAAEHRVPQAFLAPSTSVQAAANNHAAGEFQRIVRAVGLTSSVP